MNSTPAAHHSPAMPTTRVSFIEQAVADFQSPLIAYASSILNDPDRARDVVQDTFIRLCKQDPQSLQDHLKSWLFTVCRNRALDVLRKDQRNPTLDESHAQHAAQPDHSPDALADIQDQLARVMIHLTRLSENQRDVILLKFQQGLTYQEIHHITGLSTGNIGFIIHSGLKRLRSLLRTTPQQDDG